MILPTTCTAHRDALGGKTSRSVPQRRGGREGADRVNGMAFSWARLPTMTRQGRRIDHATLPIVASPSGLPTQHLVCERDGATSLFLAQQWLEPGQRVYLHTHEVEETLTFLDGEGVATMDGEDVAIRAGVSLFIPPGVVHGFRCTAGRLHVLVTFPVPYFAETRMVEERAE